MTRIPGWGSTRSKLSDNDGPLKKRHRQVLVPEPSEGDAAELRWELRCPYCLEYVEQWGDYTADGEISGNQTRRRPQPCHGPPRQG